MLYVGQVEYKMTENEEWKKGWLVGEHIDTANTLLDENFNPVPKTKDDYNNEYICWEYRRLMFSGVMIQV